MNLNDDINKKIIDFIQELIDDGFVRDGYWYEKGGEFVNVAYKIKEIKYGADIDTENYGALKSSFTILFSDLLKIPESLLSFLRRNSEEQIKIYIQQNFKSHKETLESDF